MATPPARTEPRASEDLIPDRALRGNDEDAFNHEAIASNLARHVQDGAIPLNIALYGPWGSGKSSVYELLRRHLENTDTRLVRYDASRYGGESLRRNFISHAADQLGFEAESRDDHDRRFHDGLYESRKSATVKLPRSFDDWKEFTAPVAVFLAVMALLVVLIALVGWGISYTTSKSVMDQVGALLTGLAVPSGVLALVAAAAKAVMDGASLTTEQSKPSADEQFRRRFDQLVEAARDKHSLKRLVFFVDELDRCAPNAVVETLISIKTFLDHDHCVFIVAADRDVLEQALETDSQQASPLNEDRPYYTSASSFLDKVFHHQTFLPPLRKTKLTHYARERVHDRGGLWKELRDHGGQEHLDRVVYALVPSHVTSPRRVKVLLNNFATNARIIQSRGMEYLERAPEIARLTVLQTEFSELAGDLPLEPRLPEYLLDEPEGPSPRLKRLLNRHQAALDDEGEPVEPTAELPETEISPHRRAGRRPKSASAHSAASYSKS